MIKLIKINDCKCDFTTSANIILFVISFINIKIINFAGIRNVFNRIPVSRSLPNIHHPLGPASSKDPATVEGEAEREESQTLRDVQAGTVRSLQKGSSASVTTPSSARTPEEAGIGRIRPAWASRRPKVSPNVVSFLDCVRTFVAIVRVG